MNLPFYMRAHLNPDFDPARTLPNFETNKWAASLRQRYIATLLREGSYESRNLAIKLQRCREARCGSGACPVCWRRFRRWFTCSALAALDVADRSLSQLSLVTVVVGHYRQSKCNLESFDVRKAAATLSKQLKRAKHSRELDYTLVIGGLHVDYHEHQGESFPPAWTPHFHLITDANVPDIRRVVKSHYGRCSAIRVMVRGTPLGSRGNDPVGAFTYIVKTEGQRKISRSERLGTLSFSLDELLPELLLYLDSVDPTDRIFTIGMQRYGTRFQIPACPSSSKEPDG